MNALNLRTIFRKKFVNFIINIIEFNIKLKKKDKTKSICPIQFMALILQSNLQYKHGNHTEDE